ncbi:MAG TPA: hypothetical protein VHZ56_05820 [Devosia sp.]|jgi:hypothetical protein|nr:hypothetical protein [Devosia sp.]
MADYRLLMAQGKHLVFAHDKEFSDLWKEIRESEVVEFDAELVDGDDRYMGHVAVQRQHIIGLFLERSRGHG